MPSRAKKARFSAAAPQGSVWKGRTIMKMLRLPCIVIAAAGPFLLPVSAFPQGSLNPPGPPAPTMKRLDEVEPRTNLQATPAPPGVDTSNADYQFIINQPGSYYPSANILVTKANGIQINAEGVTLDLNGFQISRDTPSGYGIEIPAGGLHATVCNGTVKGFAAGIYGIAKACALRGLVATGCTSYGILGFPGAVIEFCRAHDNSGTAAIFAASGATLTNCTANNNTAAYGIGTGSGCNLSNCSVFLNTGSYGIAVYGGCALTNCSAASNTGTTSASGGIYAGPGSTLTHCSAYSNSSNAAPTANTGIGFNLDKGCTIHNCTAQLNRGDAIQVISDCLVRENDCGFNAAGIHSTGGNNRIEGNNVIGNDRGINVDAAGNLIIKNSASNNTIDYAIAASNRYGPIIDISAGGAPAVSGKSAADTTMTTHPWANFSY